MSHLQQGCLGACRGRPCLGPSDSRDQHLCTGSWGSAFGAGALGVTLWNTGLRGPH